ncbi:MAG: hypothetical protein ABFS86_05885 [Planctomycetota bacterium]
MLDTAAGRGHLPPDRSGLRKRVFRAVVRDRANRKPVLRRTALPLHPRAALVAAAALILVAFGVRYLGDSRWNGRLLSQGGAHTLVTGDGERFAFVAEEEREVGHGDLVLVLPGQPARIELPDGGAVLLPSPALIALDSSQGRPRVLVARGYVEIHSGPDGPVAVNAAGREFTVRGIADFVVEETSRSTALRWASGELGLRSQASFFPDAWAAASSRSDVTAHSREGRVEDQSGLTIHAGQASRFPPGSRQGTPPFRIGGHAILRPDSGFLDPAESGALRQLLARTGGDRLKLAREMAREMEDDPAGPSPSLACLAAWLLGEIGHADGIEPLRRVIDSDPPRDAVLRSAATAALVRLVEPGTVPSPWGLVRDDQPAVAEAALLSCTEAELGDVAGHLWAVFDDENQPDDRRVLAAALLRKRGHPVPNALLYGFLTVDDATVAILAAKTLAEQEGGATLLARYLPEAGDGLAAVILTSILHKGYRDAEAQAQTALSRTRDGTDPASRQLFAAALNYLGVLRARHLEGPIARAIRSEDPAIRKAALVALLRAGSGEHRDVVNDILRSPGEPTSLRLSALRYLHPTGPVPEDLLSPEDADFDAAVRARLLAADAAGIRKDLARTSLDHAREVARRAAWTWLAKHAPVDAIDRAERWLRSPGRVDSPAVVEAMALVSGARPGSSLPLRHQERVAEILGAVIVAPADRPTARSDALRALGILTKDRPRNVAGSPAARRIFRTLVKSENLPRDLRRRAATTLASYAREEEDTAPLASLLKGEDADLAAAVARSFATQVPPAAAKALNRFRRITPHPVARARLALCPPFDRRYATSVLDSGDDTAVGIVLMLLTPEEVALVREAVTRRLDDDRALIRFLAVLLLDQIPDRLFEDRDAWVRIAAMAVRARAGVVPDKDLLASAITAAGEPGDRAIEDALRQFSAAGEPARAKDLLKVLARAPEARSFQRVTGRIHPKPDRQKFAVELGIRSRELRSEALKRLLSDEAAPRRARAATILGNVGRRPDLAVLFRVAGSDSTDREVRRAALRAAASLLSRSVDVADPGPALEILQAWWSKRLFALPVPVLPR